ncbi:MAG: hypothetical protein LBP56_07700 [Odoribacteraceae bacterium]|jgi:hypothetical protein|nr:hypothetical protein [Odoribacteraceae bacterium]
MSRHEVNFGRLALLLLPTFWRRPLLAALARAATRPAGDLHARFTGFRREVDRRLSRDGQACYLRAALNDRFDPVERRIRLSEPGVVAPAVFLHERGEERSLLLAGRGGDAVTVVNRRGFGGINGVDFWVNVPLELAGETARIRAVAATYKLASKRFSINYISS